MKQQVKLQKKNRNISPKHGKGLVHLLLLSMRGVSSVSRDEHMHYIEWGTVLSHQSLDGLEGEEPTLT
jgi:hypothetical protein